MLVFFLSRIVIDVGECIEFVGHDVDVVAADAVALTGNALALVGAGDGMELAALYFALFSVEVGSNGIYAGRIAHEYDTVGQLFRLQMQVETGAVSIDNQFGFWKMFLVHRLISFIIEFLVLGITDAFLQGFDFCCETFVLSFRGNDVAGENGTVVWACFSVIPA